LSALEEIKDQIKSVPISTIVANYIPINKHGINYEAICPFHADTKPSLKINDQKGIFKCFACEAAGDSISFVSKYKHIDFKEAIKEIANFLGFSTEGLESKKKLDPKYEMGLRVVSSAYKVYRKYAIEKNPTNFTEFIQKRKLSQEVIDSFEIGYAPANNLFTNYLQSIPSDQRELAHKIAIEIGIIKKGQYGDYDFYRERAIFPIFDHYGNPRGFSSRAILPDQMPKYLNSSESFIFHKADILYGYHLAKDVIRSEKKVLLVEGNMDVVTLHQFGFNYSVGTMGVALGEKNKKLLINSADQIFLGLDSDPAGLKAMLKINEMFMQDQVLPKYISYAPAKDPDDFLHQFGRLKLQEVIENAPIFVDFYISEILFKEMPNTTDGKIKLLNQIFELLKPLGDSLLALEIINNKAKYLGISSGVQDLKNAYLDYLQANKKNTFFPKKSKENEEQDIAHKVIPEAVVSINSDGIIGAEKISKLENLLLHKLISYPSLLESDLIAGILDFVSNNDVKRMIDWLQRLYFEIDDTQYYDVLKFKMEQAEFSQELTQIIAAALFDYKRESLDPKVKKKMLCDFQFKLKRDFLKKKSDHLKQKQKVALTETESVEFIKQIQAIENEILTLKNNYSIR
jgi:DNA primase